MKVYELLSFNREFLRRIYNAGIKSEDYKYVDLYNEFESRKMKGEKVTYIVASLSVKYAISERKIYSIIDRLKRDCNTCAV
ncbi:hypothetical protein EZS27_001355 [termite gut metagenome]|uniref:Mor transcription activator domain-containing protein n=1 Tax=termite gut metagenome TaxID=433724 RepID=A0A5J4SYA3_9ZZZZ